MGVTKLTTWSIFCGDCYDNEEIMEGDPIGDRDPEVLYDRVPKVWTTADARKAFRAEGWMIRRDGTTLCPSCAGREDRS